MPETKLPWPSDAVMIVASNRGEEHREFMESVVECECRDCGAPLAADSKRIRYADEMDVRHGRPIRFFCIACCVKYDRQSITELHDHRGGTTKHYWTGEGDDER